jgi:hypothetical protein
LVRFPEIGVFNFAHPVTGSMTAHSGPYSQIGDFIDPISEPGANLNMKAENRVSALFRPAEPVPLR